MEELSLIEINIYFPAINYLNVHHAYKGVLLKIGYIGLLDQFFTFSSGFFINISCKKRFLYQDVLLPWSNFVKFMQKCSVYKKSSLEKAVNKLCMLVTKGAKTSTSK